MVVSLLKEPKPCRVEEEADGKEEEAVGTNMKDKRVKKKENRARLLWHAVAEPRRSIRRGRDNLKKE